MEHTSPAVHTSPSDNHSSPEHKNQSSPPPPPNGYTYPSEIHIVAPPVQFRRFGNAAALGLIT
ncbi:hypothetical protein FBU31_006277, partial [Coemansia sp. 'formosensis']